MTRAEAGRLGYLKSKAYHEEQFRKRTAAYNLNPVRCPQCSEALAYESRRNRFCSQHCSAIYNNLGRSIHGRYKVTEAKPCRGCGKDFFSKNRYCGTCIGNGAHLEARRVKDVTEAKTDRYRRKCLILTHGHTCMECKNSLWNGVLIPLELDHKDGNSLNNSPSNLRVLCPNCHALTPTYKGKNKGNGRFERLQRFKEGKSF